MNWKVVGSIGISLLTIVLVVTYDLLIKDRALSIEVVVASERIERHMQFSADNLTVERRNRDELVDGFITPSAKVDLIGKDANVTILKNQMISEVFVDYVNLTPDAEKNEAIRPIPANWIYAMPGSLRRKDVITIYPLQERGVGVQQNIITVDKVMSDEEANNSTPTELASRFQPILENVPVNYVKTSSNQEVMNREDSDERLNASGNASDIEVNITEDELKLLFELIEQGYKLYISYR